MTHIQYDDVIFSIIQNKPVLVGSEDGVFGAWSYQIIVIDDRANFFSLFINLVLETDFFGRSGLTSLVSVWS